MKRLLGIAVMTCFVLLASGANGALVKVGNLVLTADGGFTPSKLPRRSYAPIDFRGFTDLRSTDGSVPVALQQAVIDFDRDGRLTTAGLATCQPAVLTEATPLEARSRCRTAIVGTGHIEALIAREGQPPVPTSSALTLFNGPRQEGNPTVILHARTTVPAAQTFVISVPIDRRGGAYRYRATVDVPPIAGGFGSITHLDVKVGRRYTFHGSKRSYAAARCGDGIFRTHGRFTFADGIVIDGSIEKACTVR
jgi:hypothetical protein